MEFVAHVIDKNNQQSVSAHLKGTAKLAREFAMKIGLTEAGELIGLLHDFGKYSEAFQIYIQTATGLIDPDRDDQEDVASKKGKIDHSTAGAQWLWRHMTEFGKENYPSKEDRMWTVAAMQMLALCIASHHGGLIDNLPTVKGKGFLKRIQKLDCDSHYTECLLKADKGILDIANTLVSKPLLQKLIDKFKQIDVNEPNDSIKAFYHGMLVKFVFSCLIDADRINSADFEVPENEAHRHLKSDWDVACDRVESFISRLKIKYPVDEIRQEISNHCKQKANEEQGIKSLTVATGGGKTFASLRYAVHHAKKHGLDRIIYIIPFTSIIDQNAQAIREVLECEGDEQPWVFEHHSNLEPEVQTWRSKLVCENWDAPIVLTTMVQFLECLFGAGTRGVRKLHQLANSVLIFDEIQTLPVNCVHLFNNAINFLATHCGATAVMCTATQPVLNKLRNPEKGQLQLRAEDELIPQFSKYFDALKRTEIIDKTKIGGWSVTEVAELAITQLHELSSCLVIVNTKKWAEKLFKQCKSGDLGDSKVFHLSTAQCPAHRKVILDEVRDRLNKYLPTLCISTQLIEAGVDVDFASVIRFVAGLDSVAQSGGRCNRNGLNGIGRVLLINPDHESIESLIDIVEGQKVMRRVLKEFGSKELLTPNAMSRYFEYFFHQRSAQMSYPIGSGSSQHEDLLNLLSLNSQNTSVTHLPLKHSFKTAGAAFKAIDAPTQSIIVPYAEGYKKLTELCSLSAQFDAKRYRELLRELQKYSVNVFPNTWKSLQQQQDAIIELEDEIGAGLGIFYLDKKYYSLEFGLCAEQVSKMDSLMC